MNYKTPQWSIPTKELLTWILTFGWKELEDKTFSDDDSQFWALKVSLVTITLQSFNTDVKWTNRPVNNRIVGQEQTPLIQ